LTDETKPVDSSTLLVEPRDDGLLIVTLNRPDEGNAVNTQMGIELLDLWTGLVRNGDAARCVVLTGAGNEAFCAGGDMKQRKGMSDADWRHQHEIFEQALWTMMECPVPVIAAVNGKAFGGGLEMDVRAALRFEVEAYNRLVDTEDRLEGVLAWNEQRKPVFKGR
jgi:enoyl-CoA hydratase/carnithine racemase